VVRNLDFMEGEGESRAETDVVAEHRGGATRRRVAARRGHRLIRGWMTGDERDRWGGTRTERRRRVWRGDGRRTASRKEGEGVTRSPNA
jgi:hypothetical protein